MTEYTFLGELNEYHYEVLCKMLLTMINLA